MSILGDRLELGEGAVLASIHFHHAAIDRLRPRWPRVRKLGIVEAGTLYLHRIDLSPAEDLPDAARNLLAHMPDGVVALSGIHEDDYGWVTTCQLALADHRFVNAEGAAESAVQRAMRHAGLDEYPSSIPHYTTGDLRAAFERSAEVDLGHWGIDLLLFGGVVEMTGRSIDEVVAYAEHDLREPHLTDGPERDQQVEGRLREMIGAWVDEGI